jgi:hypothetical protein
MGELLEIASWVGAPIGGICAVDLRHCALFFWPVGSHRQACFEMSDPVVARCDIR